MTSPRQTSRSTATRLNATMLIIAAVILIAIAGLSSLQWSQYSRARSEALRSRGVLESVNNLLSILLDAEAGQRGFLLTGEVRYLEPYDRVIRAVPVELANLNRLLAQQPVEADRVARLNSLVDQKLTELRQTIELRRTRGAAPAVDLVLSEQGKQIMDEIRGISSEIRRQADSTLDKARTKAESATQRAFWTMVAGPVVLLAFFVIGNITINRAIAAREQSLTEAQQARDALQTTLASIGDAVISTDTEGRILLANKVAQSLLRATEAEVVGKHLDDVFRIVNEFTHEKVESPVTKVLREGAVVGLANHTVLIGQDGTETPIDDSGAPIRGEGGPIEGTVLVFRDITDRRRAEATGRLLASIVESSEDAIISKDLNGVVTSWNHGAEQIFGYTAQEMIGRPISVLAAPDRPDEMPGILERIKRGERIDHYETVRRTKSGNLIHASVTISPVRDASGRITGASKILRDITAQLRAQAEMAEQRERLRVTLSSIGDAVMTTDVAGCVSYLNPVAEQLTGWTTGEAYGHPLEEVFRIVNEESRLTVENPVTRVLREGAIVGLANHTLLISREGNEISIDDSAAPIRDNRGEMLGVVLIFRDIAERKRIEEQRLELLSNERALASERTLRETEAELARVVRALSVGELAASIAHEVNQPLAGVVTNAEAGLRWLSGEAPSLEEAKESLALIVRDGNRASAVIRRIREFLKKESLDAESIDINGAIQEAAGLAGAELLKRQITLRLELSGDLPPVRGDRIQLQQVILNLIMNGGEAMASTDGPKELRLTSQKSDGPGGHPSVLVAVRDRGVGIKPQDMQRMFDAFFTTKTNGMGMGLSISRSIMEAHGGRIWAEANDGPGLTVQFSLPGESSAS